MGQGKKIVVVDDSPQITRLVENILCQEGYRVAVCNDAADGAVLVDRERPDLVVLDICMPGIDGWDLCQRIRQTHTMPILVLSVLSESRDIERTLQAGADAHLTKPFTISVFLECVQHLLSGEIRRLRSRERRR